MKLSGWGIAHIWTTHVLGHHKASTLEKTGKWNLQSHTNTYSYKQIPVSAFCCFQVQFVKSSVFPDRRFFSLSYHGKTAVLRIKVGSHHCKIFAKKSWYQFWIRRARTNWKRIFFFLRYLPQTHLIKIQKEKSQRLTVPNASGKVKTYNGDDQTIMQNIFFCQICRGYKGTK